MDLIWQIVKTKREKLNYLKTKKTLKELKAQARDMPPPLDFSSSIKKGESSIKLIAEIKKASPTKGILRGDFNIIRIAEIYEKSPVDAISVITEEEYFKGALSFLTQVRVLSRKPLLRKDFIIDEYQIYESRINKADAILLISAILEKSEAEEYYHLASELGLAVLFEIHDEDDLDKAIDINANIIGINNRNLKTFDINLSNSLRLKQYIPEGRIVIAESGIKCGADVKMLYEASFDGILVGSSIMEAQDMKSKIEELKLINF